MNDHNTEYDRLFSRAVEVLTSAGISALKEYVSSIQDRDYRDVTLGKVGVLLVIQNRPTDALQLAQMIQQPMERADALLAMAREHVKMGQRAEAKVALEAAVSIAEKIPGSTWETPSIFLQISAEMYEVSSVSQALSLLSRAVDLARKGHDFDSAKVLSGCAMLLVKWGRHDEATAVVNFISQPELRTITLQRIAE